MILPDLNIVITGLELDKPLLTGQYEIVSTGLPRDGSECCSGGHAYKNALPFPYDRSFLIERM